MATTALANPGCRAASLLYGVTTYIVTDIVAIPLLLREMEALYLLSLVLAFACWPVIWVEWPHKLMLFVNLNLMVAMVIMISKDYPHSPFHQMGVSMGNVLQNNMLIWLALPMLTFFAAALVCHGELAKDRPDGWRLVEFWLLIVAGAALGVVFNSLIAPQIFTELVELPLALFYWGTCGIQQGLHSNDPIS